LKSSIRIFFEIIKPEHSKMPFIQVLIWLSNSFVLLIVPRDSSSHVKIIAIYIIPNIRTPTWSLNLCHRPNPNHMVHLAPSLER